MNCKSAKPQDVVEGHYNAEEYRMSFFKILLNTAIVTAVASGVYYYLDQNARRNAESAEDPEAAPHALDSENIKDAADRAYTTIKHGTDEVAENIKKSVGPQGEEIIDEVTEAADKVRETVTYAGKKVGGIVTDTDSSAQEKASAVAETVRYAAADLMDKFKRAPEVEVTEAAEDANVASAEDFVEEDDPEITVEFYEAEAEETAAQTEPEVQVYVEAAGEESAAAEQAAEDTAAAEAPAEDADAETTAAPVNDAATVEEFFDTEA